ncbi:MAG: Ig-like domain-containing protein [Gemmatimonadaceae bacterium]
MTSSHRTTIALLVAVAVAGCGGGGGGVGTTSPPPSGATLDRIVVTPATFSLTAGQSQVLTAAGQTAAGASVSGTTLSYSSSNTSVASVSTTGTVVGLSAGASTITVTGTAGGVSRSTTALASVTGTLPNAVTVAAGNLTNDFTPRNIAVARGGSVTWTFGVTAHDVDFQGQAGAPANIPITASNGGITRTFNNAGSFGYICTIHSGMSGGVFVP